MLYFDKKLIANHRQVSEAWNELTANRQQFNIAQSAMQKMYGTSLMGNQAALIHKDYWREVDAVTTTIMRDENSNSLLDRFMNGLSRPIAIGKTAALYRSSSDAGKVVKSMSGQAPEELDKVVYTTEGDAIGIFKTGTSRNWREWQGMSTEGLDAAADDTRECTYNLRQEMTQTLLFGADEFVAGPYTGKGLTNHAATQQIDLSSINLTSATTQEVLDFWTDTFPKLLDAQNIGGSVEVWVSKEIRHRIRQPLSDAAGYKMGSIEEEIKRFSRITSFNTAPELLRNRFVAFDANQQYVSMRVAAPVGSYMVTRMNPHDNYNQMYWSAFGLQVKKDYNGLSRVFYGEGTQGD